eukprot:1306078-Prymnesium_polylepis.1
MKEPPTGAASGSSSSQGDEKFTEMLKVLKGMSEQQKAMETSHEESMAKAMKEIGDLRSKIGRNRKNDRGDRERGDNDKSTNKKDGTCSWCKKKGHFVASCPEMLKALKQREEEE